jgi:hypothetical protein
MLFLLVLVLLSSCVSTTSEAPSVVSISLGAPQQLFHLRQLDALGMRGVPDQPLTPIQEADKSYRLFIAAGEIGDFRGSTGLISTKDFLTYTPVVGNRTEALPVLTPSCRFEHGEPGLASCRDNFDAEYAGVDHVFPSSNGRKNNLLMIYQGTTATFGTTYSDDAFYSVVALASSSDNGVHWTRQGPIVTGSDAKPSTDPKNGANGADQSGAIVANGYIYDFFPYFSTKGGDEGIQVARAPIDKDGKPGSWTKYYEGSFGFQPGLGGLGSMVAPTTSGCTRPAQPWLAFSTYLNEYVMVFICSKGWFFSTSTDLVTWTTGTLFHSVQMFTKGNETDENPSLVTPGNAGQMIGESGYVLYGETPKWGSGIETSQSYRTPLYSHKPTQQTTKRTRADWMGL